MLILVEGTSLAMLSGSFLIGLPLIALGLRPPAARAARSRTR